MAVHRTVSSAEMAEFTKVATYFCFVIGQNTYTLWKQYFLSLLKCQKLSGALMPPFLNASHINFSTDKKTVLQLSWQFGVAFYMCYLKLYLNLVFALTERKLLKV